MQNGEGLSQEQIQEFLRSSEPIEFAGGAREERYAWVERVLAAQKYGELGQRQRGLVRAYVQKVTGLSAAQTTRLIRAFLDPGSIRAQPYQRYRFAAKYTTQDLALRAEVDRAHGRLSGPPTRRILEREYEQFGQEQYPQRAKIRVAHLYNLRASARYRNRRRCSSRRSLRRWPWGSGANPIRKDGRDLYGWTRYPQATAMAPRACIPSTPWTRGRHGRWWAAPARSAKRICGRCGKRYGRSFPFKSGVFTPTTARSPSTIAWRRG